MFWHPKRTYFLKALCKVQWGEETFPVLVKCFPCVVHIKVHVFLDKLCSGAIELALKHYMIFQAVDKVTVPLKHVGKDANCIFLPKAWPITLSSIKLKRLFEQLCPALFFHLFIMLTPDVIEGALAPVISLENHRFIVFVGEASSS